MRLRHLCLLATVSVLPFGLPQGAQAQSGAALTGTVSSSEEGNMEGVLVNAKKDGSTITITVVSDDKGNYAFPADRLSPGKYKITMRASGYTMAAQEATVAA